MTSEGSQELRPLTWFGVWQEPQVSPCRVPWPQTIVGSGSGGTPVNPSLPSQLSPVDFSSPDIPGASPTQKAPPAPAAPADFQSLKLTAHFLKPSLQAHLIAATLVHWWWDCKLLQPLCKIMEVPQKKIHFWVFFKWNKTIIWKWYLHLPHIHCSKLTTARKWKQTHCPLGNEWTRKPWYTMDYYPVIRKSDILPTYVDESWG